MSLIHRYAWKGARRTVDGSVVNVDVKTKCRCRRLLRTQDYSRPQDDSKDSYGCYLCIVTLQYLGRSEA